jgi:DNA N-6-adenine-methyltransferase (Dam)
MREGEDWVAIAFVMGSQANKAHLGYVGRQPGTPVRDSDEWYTPRCFIEHARTVMGTIDLDPFSSPAANQVVKAAYYFDPLTSAFDRPWRSPKQKRQYPNGVNVWMNPPYGMPLIAQAIDTLGAACHRGDVAQAIVLVNNATETRWFQLLCELGTALCFPRQRIAFTAPDGKAIGGNTRGQAFFYLAPYHNKTADFLQEFAAVGFVIPLKEQYACPMTPFNPRPSPMVQSQTLQDSSQLSLLQDDKRARTARL